MNQKGEKIGKVLKNNGLIFPSSSNRPKKIIPLFIEDENVKFERNQIIKSHSIFQNEINNNYTNYYLDNVSDLLFQNDKLYYKKRNRLTIKNPTLPELYYQNQKPAHIKKSITVDSFPQTPTQRSLSLSHVYQNKQEPYYSRYYLTENLLHHTKDGNRLAEIVHLSNKMNKVYCKNFKKLLIRRINGVKDVNIVSTPVQKNKTMKLIGFYSKQKSLDVPQIKNMFNKSAKLDLKTNPRFSIVKN